MRGPVRLGLRPAVGAQSVRDRTAPGAERSGRSRPNLWAGVHRLGGDRFDRASVALVGGQPGGHQVDPAVDDVGDRESAVQKAAQPPLDVGADAVDDRRGQFLLAVGEVVIERARLDVSGLEDLVHPGRGVALPAKQQGRRVDERGSASIRTWHALTLLERSLKNT